MASSHHPEYSSVSMQGFRAELQTRVTVYDLFIHCRQVLSGLPGEISQFEQSDFGYKWHCEFEIAACAPTVTQNQTRDNHGHSLHLHFSLVDLDRHLRPAAVLYLVEHDQDQGDCNRLPLPLNDLTETHEQLNECLTQRETTIEVFDKANRFIVALEKVRESLGNEVAWA
jgi:hypothetical protein